MTDANNEMNAVAPGEAITDFGSLKAQQQTIHTWRVLNLQGGENPPTAYEVNTLSGSCSCDAEKYSSDDNRACKHLAYVLSGCGQSMDVSDALTFDLGNAVRDARDALTDVRSLADAQPAQPTASVSDTSQGGSGNDADDEDDADDDDGQVVAVDPKDSQAGLVANLESWFDDLADTLQFDADIIDISWARADGVDGAIIEREPFTAGYYDDGEWQDKETFDGHKETVGDSILSPRDEFTWYGEPDYDYFVAEEDILAVVGDDE